MTKKLVGIAIVAALGLAATAFAGTHVTIKSPDVARQQAFLKTRNDHPLTQVVGAKDVKIVINTDAIMHSCCMPPNLVVAGNITNIASVPVNYVKLIFSFEDANGKVLHAESIYNLRAASMNDDAEVSRILNEKPHFDPLAPGATDTFAFSIPLPMLPRFAKVELYPDVKMQ